MPFSGRLFEPDDSPLPDELAALAAQLADDANYLAASYPAPALTPAVFGGPAIAPRTRTAWLVRSASGVAGLSSAAALILAAVFFWELPTADHQVPQAPRQTAATEPPFAAADSEAALHHEPIAAPAIASVRTLSGPELEAVLDLLERESSEASRVSF